MDSQEKLSLLINNVHDYTTIIKKTVLNNKPLSDNQVMGYLDVKNKCLQALRDIILLTESSKITSATANTLSYLLFNVSSANQLNRDTLQKVVGVCDALKKDIIIDDVIHKAKEKKAALFQLELLPLKKLFWFSETFVFEKATTKFFLDDSAYKSMSSQHIQSIIDEASRVQKYFLKWQRRKNDIPVWFLRFIYTFSDFVAKKHKQAKSEEVSDNLPLSRPEFLPKKRRMPVDFDLSYKHLENFLFCESYISARDLCQDMITAFPDDKRTPDLKEKLEKIYKCIEDMKNVHSSSTSTKKISVPAKKIDPGLIDPTTGRLKDDFF